LQRLTTVQDIQIMRVSFLGHSVLCVYIIIKSDIIRIPLRPSDGRRFISAIWLTLPFNATDQRSAVTSIP